MPKKFTHSEAARYCGLTYMAVLYAIQTGELKPDETTAGGKPLFYEKNLDNLLENRKRGRQGWAGR